MEIREILSSLIKEINRVLATLGGVLYKPINNIFLSCLNILKVSSDVFNKIADFGVYVFPPYLRAIQYNLFEEGVEVKPSSSQLIQPSSVLQPHISYSLEFIKKLQPTRIRGKVKAGVEESSISYYPLTTFYDDLTALTTPVTLVTSKMVKSKPYTLKAQQRMIKEQIIAQEVTPSVKTVSDSFTVLREVFRVLSLKPAMIQYGKKTALGHTDGIYYEILPETSKGFDLALTSVISAISLPLYLMSEAELYKVKGEALPSETELIRHIEYSSVPAYRPVLSPPLTDRDHLLIPLFILALSWVSKYIKSPLQPLQKSYLDYITYSKQALDVAVKPSGLGPSTVPLFIPHIQSRIESYLYSKESLSAIEQAYSVTQRVVPSFPTSSVFTYSPVKQLTEFMVDLQPLLLGASHVPYSDQLEAHPLSMYKVSVSSIALSDFHPFRHMPASMVKALMFTRHALNKVLPSSYLMTVDGFVIKQIDIVRLETSSPLVTSSIEYTRTIREFRMAELEAEQEILASKSYPSLSTEKPLLTPSYLIPEVQNIFQITVPEESDLDLKELERKITRILNEQVRRYYGYLS
ncbi:MAG: hypothetical protein QXJ17_05540 [Nitrososphaeria archaeon]